MIKLIYLWFLTTILLWTSISIAKSNNDTDLPTKIAEANDLYQKGRFSEASDIYQSLISSGYQNGYLYFNAGNSSFREGRQGQAILNYRKALKMLPRDQNVFANLNYAVMETKDKIFEPPKLLISKALFWIDNFSTRELAIILILVNFIFWCSIFGRSILRTTLWEKTALITGIILAILLVSTGGKIWLESNYKTAVVISSQIEVKSAASLSNVALFELHEGAIFRIGEERGDWVEIILDEKKTGWVLKEKIALI